MRKTLLFTVLLLLSTNLLFAQRKYMQNLFIDQIPGFDNMAGVEFENGKFYFQGDRSKVPYRRLHTLRDGLYRAQKDRLWGVIDQQQKVLLPFEYEYVNQTDEGYLIVKKDGKFGVLNTSFQPVIPMLYQDLVCEDIQNCIAMLDGKWGVLVNTRDVLIPFEYLDIERAAGKTYMAKKTHYWGIINRQNEWVIPEKYSNSKIRQINADRYLVQEGKQWQLIGTDNGVEVLQTFAAEGGQNLYRPVIGKIGDYWGIFNKNGEAITPVIYDQIHRVGNPKLHNFFSVTKNGRSGIFKVETEMQGTMLLDTVFQSISTRSDLGSEYRFIASEDGRFGFYDDQGKALLPPEFTMIYVQKVNRQPYVIAQKEGAEGAYDPDGQLIKQAAKVEIGRETITGYSNRFLTFQELDGSWGVFDLESKKQLLNGQEEIEYLGGDCFKVKKGLWGIFVTDEGLVSDYQFEKIEMVRYQPDRYTVQGPVYFKVQPFTEDGDPVRYGLLNRLGETLLPPDQEELRFIAAGMMYVEKGDRWAYYLPEKGKMSDFEYRGNPRRFGDQLIVAKVSEGEEVKYGLIDHTGAVIIPFIYENMSGKENRLLVTRAGKRGILDAEGKVVIPIEYKSVWLGENNTVFLQEDALWSMQDSSGKEIIPAILESQFIDKKSLIRVASGGKYGFVNYRGELIVPYLYDDADYFDSDGVCIVKMAGKSGVINEQHQVIVPVEMDTVIRNSFKSTFTVMKKNSAGNEQWGVYHQKRNEPIIPLEYDMIQVAGFDGQQFYVGQKAGKKGLINGLGKIMIPFEYDGLTTAEGNCIAVKEGRFGLLSTRGHTIIPLAYDAIQGYKNTLYGVVQDGEAWLMNTRGETVSKKYDQLEYMGSSIFKVKTGEKFGFIEASGKVIIPIVYDEITDFRFWGETEPGLLARTRIGEKYGYIRDRIGELTVLLEAKYTELRAFQDGAARVSDGNKWGFIDKNGTFFIPLEYDMVEPFENGYSKVTKGAKVFYIDRENRCVRDCG